MGMQNRPTAIIYARVSSTKQAAEELPIQSQIESTMARALALNAIVVKVFKDEGISGRTSKRDAFQAAVAYCEMNSTDLFITWNSARFSRDHLDDGEFRRRLRKAGTEIVEVADGVGKSGDAWLFEGLRALINEKYSRDVARDTKRSLIKNAIDGHFNGGRVPYGYTVIVAGKRRKLAPLKNESAIVKDVFEKYVSGQGCLAIASDLNKLGILRRGQHWSKGNVGNTLRCEKYIGTTIFNRVDRATKTEYPPEEWITTKSHEAIIGEDIFMKAQSLMSSRAPAAGNSSARSQHVFTGMMVCTHCDSAMTTASGTGRGGKRYSYYNCRGHLQKGICANRAIDAKKFDNFLMHHLVDTLFTPQQISEIMAEITRSAATWSQERTEDRKKIVNEIRAIEARQDRLYDVLEAHGKDAPEFAAISPRITQNYNQLKKLQEQLAQLETAPDLKPLKIDLEQATEFLKSMVFQAADCAAQRSFFAGFIREIRVGDGAVTVDFQPEKIVNQPGIQLVHSNEFWLPDLFLMRTEKLVVALPRGLSLLAA